LGNAFGDFTCANINTILYLKGVPWLGAMIGAIFIGPAADNFGRRPVFLVCLVLTVAGYAIMLLASNMIVSALGLFLVGFSLYSEFPIMLTILAEILDNDWRQKV
jgi:MFS family permease